MGGRPDLVRWALSGYARGSGDTYGPRELPAGIAHDRTLTAASMVNTVASAVQRFDDHSFRRRSALHPAVGQEASALLRPFRRLAAFSAPAAGV